MENAVKNSFCGCLLVVISGLTGCNSPAVYNAPVESRQPEIKREIQEVELSIHELLYRGEVALSKNRLKVPAHDNALKWYLKVLARDPLHSEARLGLDRISERYLDLAEQAMLAGESGRADVFIQRALDVTATPAQVSALWARFQTPELANNEYALDKRALSQRNEQVKQRLVDIANQAKQVNSRLLIVARNDDEGRWIYQQMRQSVSGYRLRGNIEKGHIPRVVLIDVVE